MCDTGNSPGNSLDFSLDDVSHEIYQTGNKVTEMICAMIVTDNHTDDKEHDNRDDDSFNHINLLFTM